MLSKQSQWPEFISEDSHNSPRTLPALGTQVYEGKGQEDHQLAGFWPSQEKASVRFKERRCFKGMREE